MTATFMHQIILIAIAAPALLMASVVLAASWFYQR